MLSVEELLERLGSPAEVLDRHGIMVRRRMARCPFHDDKTPSLSLYRAPDGRERWRCHGCGEHGDAADLESKLSGRSLRDLLEEERW